jgi:hypothetical protein
LIDCILTGHGYRGKVYPTYCKCYVFTPAPRSFIEVVELRCFLLQAKGGDGAPSTESKDKCSTRVSTAIRAVDGESCLRKYGVLFPTYLSSSVFAMTGSRTCHCSILLDSFQWRNVEEASTSHTNPKLPRIQFHKPSKGHQSDLDLRIPFISMVPDKGCEM